MEGDRLSPLDSVSPFALFGGLDDEAWRWLNVEGRSECPYLGRYLPSMPDESFQAAFVGTSGNDALNDGFRVYKLVRDLHGKHSGELRPAHRVLDFGCGWGRVIRFFLKDVEALNLVGVDVNPKAVEACKNTNPWCQFELCDVFPPAPLESESFDLIHAYSVFSHLSEEAHLQWLAEFERLLKPGGMVLVTTFSRDVLLQSSEWKRDPQSLLDWQRRVVDLFSPANDWLAAYDRGEFCYGSMPEFGNLHFGLTCIPEQYVRKVWGKRFTIREFLPSDGGLQAVVACTKR